jgi:hypothetical protein
MMKRRTITDHVELCTASGLEMPLDELLERVREWRDRYGGEAQLRTYTDKYETEINVVYTRPETDAEMGKRKQMLEKERERKAKADAERKEQEHAEYLRLKEIYGG